MIHVYCSKIFNLTFFNSSVVQFDDGCLLRRSNGLENGKIARLSVKLIHSVHARFVAES